MLNLYDNRLEYLETIIEKGLSTFVDVGAALLEIRDSRLYRDTYDNFEDYCRERWGMSRPRAYQLIDAAETVSNLSTIVDKLPTTESQARPLASLEPEQQREVWQTAVDTAPGGKITAAHVQSVVDNYIEPEKRPVSYHVSDDSYEWYTPEEYINAARAVMGSIDLDPASSIEAQGIVQADVYYNKETNGINQPWFGNVWLNPPYNMPLIEQFIDKAIGDYIAGNTISTIVLTNNSTDTGWFHKLINYPVCFTKGRIQFWNGKDRLATRQGQAIFYLGDDLEAFSKEFNKFGVVLVRYDNK